MTLGERLQTLRKKEELSTRELAEKSGISYASISRYETESQEPTFFTMCCIAQALDVSLDYFADKEKTAYWEREPGCGYIFRCSHCGNPDVKRANYCSCCGYKMIEKKESDTNGKTGQDNLLP